MNQQIRSIQRTTKCSCAFELRRSSKLHMKLKSRLTLERKFQTCSLSEYSRFLDTWTRLRINVVSLKQRWMKRRSRLSSWLGKRSGPNSRRSVLWTSKRLKYVGSSGQNSNNKQWMFATTTIMSWNLVQMEISWNLTHTHPILQMIRTHSRSLSLLRSSSQTWPNSSYRKTSLSV